MCFTCLPKEQTFTTCNTIVLNTIYGNRQCLYLINEHTAPTHYQWYPSQEIIFKHCTTIERRLGWHQDPAHLSCDRHVIVTRVECVPHIVMFLPVLVQMLLILLSSHELLSLVLALLDTWEFSGHLKRGREGGREIISTM